MKDTMNRRDFIRNSVVTGGVLLAHAALPANARNLTYDMYVSTRVMFGAGMLDKLSEQPMPGKRALIVISNGKSTRATVICRARKSSCTRLVWKLSCSTV